MKSWSNEGSHDPGVSILDDCRNVKDISDEKVAEGELLAQQSVHKRSSKGGKENTQGVVEQSEIGGFSGKNHT